MAGYSYTNHLIDSGEIRRSLPSVYLMTMAELRLTIAVLDPLDTGLDPAHRMAVRQYIERAQEQIELYLEQGLEG